MERSELLITSLVFKKVLKMESKLVIGYFKGGKKMKLAEGKTIYQSPVIDIGPDLEIFLVEKKLTLFNETAPDDLQNTAIIHRTAKLWGKIEAGDELAFDSQTYRITFVGEKVNEAFKNLGHFIVVFNGAKQMDLPGVLCVEAKPMPKISISTVISLKNK